MEVKLNRYTSNGSISGHFFTPLCSVSQHSFHGGTPKIIFHIPRNPPPMKIFTGQKKVIVGNLSVTTGEAALQQYKMNTDTIQLNITLNTH